MYTLYNGSFMSNSRSAFVRFGLLWVAHTTLFSLDFVFQHILAHIPLYVVFFKEYLLNVTRCCKICFLFFEVLEFG